MFKHILVPIDLSGRNERTLAATLQLAQQSRARVMLLHVIERIEHVPLPEIRAFYEKLERAARKKMVAVARKLAARGVGTRRRARSADVRRASPPLVRCLTGRGRGSYLALCLATR